MAPGEDGVEAPAVLPQRCDLHPAGLLASGPGALREQILLGEGELREHIHQPEVFSFQQPQLPDHRLEIGANLCLELNPGGLGPAQSGQQQQDQ